MSDKDDHKYQAIFRAQFKSHIRVFIRDNTSFSDNDVTGVTVEQLKKHFASVGIWTNQIPQILNELINKKKILLIIKNDNTSLYITTDLQTYRPIQLIALSKKKLIKSINRWKPSQYFGYVYDFSDQELSNAFPPAQIRVSIAQEEFQVESVPISTEVPIDDSVSFKNLSESDDITNILQVLPTDEGSISITPKPVKIAGLSSCYNVSWIYSKHQIFQYYPVFVEIGGIEDFFINPWIYDDSLELIYIPVVQELPEIELEISDVDVADPFLYDELDDSIHQQSSLLEIYYKIKPYKRISVLVADILSIIDMSEIDLIKALMENQFYLIEYKDRIEVYTLDDLPDISQIAKTILSDNTLISFSLISSFELEILRNPLKQGKILYNKFLVILRIANKIKECERMMITKGGAMHFQKILDTMNIARMADIGRGIKSHWATDIKKVSHYRLNPKRDKFLF